MNSTLEFNKRRPRFTAAALMARADDLPPDGHPFWNRLQSAIDNHGYFAERAREESRGAMLADNDHDGLG
jgi:hypothetical protein